MERIAARDSSALAELYNRHASLLLALCVRVLHDRMEAEDVMGEVFWEVWERSDRYSVERGTPVAYLLTLCRSRAVDRLRSRRQKDARTVPVNDGSELDALGGSRTDGPEDPFHGSVLSEQRRHIRSALAGLTDVQRRALELSFYDGLSHSEIAASLGEPLGTVKTRIRQGLLQLRKSLIDLHDARE